MTCVIKEIEINPEAVDGIGSRDLRIATNCATKASYVRGAVNCEFKYTVKSIDEMTVNVNKLISELRK